MKEWQDMKKGIEGSEGKIEKGGKIIMMEDSYALWDFNLKLSRGQKYLNILAKIEEPEVDVYLKIFGIF